MVVLITVTATAAADAPATAAAGDVDDNNAGTISNLQHDKMVVLMQYLQYYNHKQAIKSYQSCMNLHPLHIAA